MNSNASIWGHRSGDLCASTAFSIGLALAPEAEGPALAGGGGVAVGAFKPATLLPFLVLFLRRRDLPSWLSLGAVPWARAAAAPPGSWAGLAGHTSSGSRRTASQV